jgi:hypothetical protein
MAQLKQREIDRIYTALRPRLGGGSGGGAVVATIPAHTHSADQITSNAAGDIAADDVQEAIEEIASEKLARDGSQTVTGDLDHDHHSIVNVHDIDVEGTATVGEDVNLTEGVGGAKVTGVRVLTMAGAEGDGEGRIESVNGVAFNSITPVEEVGKLAWDDTEDTLVAFVVSGAGLVLVALGWAVKLAANGVNPS